MIDDTENVRIRLLRVHDDLPARLEMISDQSSDSGLTMSRASLYVRMA